MKKVKGLLSVGLLSLIVAVSASCNTPKVVDNVDLKEAITLFNEATSYDLTGNVPVQTQAYKNGFSTQISSRADAIEYNLTDLTTNTIVGSYGYANHPEGVMEYTYDEVGDVEPGYLIDKSTEDVVKTIKNSKKVDLGLNQITIPNALRDGDLIYTIDIALSVDKLLVQSVITKAIPGMTLEILKGYGTFKENGIYFTTDGTGKSIDLIFEYETDETGAANGEKVKFTIDNLNVQSELPITSYLAEGGTYKPLSAQANKLTELAMSDYVVRLDSTDYNGDKNKDGGIEFVYNFNYGYVGVIYDDTTTPFQKYDKNGQPVGEPEPMKNTMYIPVYGFDDIPNNFYVAFIDNEGNIDLDANDHTTFNEDHTVFQQAAADQYFTSYETMIALMVSGILTPFPYLFLFPGFDDPDTLYTLGDYSLIDADSNLYGFISLDEEGVDLIDEILEYTKEGMAEEFGPLQGFSYLFNGDIAQMKDEDIEMQLGILVPDGLVSFLYTFEGFNTNRASFDAVNDLIVSLYPDPVE